MKHSFYCTIFLLLSAFTAHTQTVNKALESFLNNKPGEAEAALLKIANNPSNKERGKAGVALAVIYKLQENDEEKVKYFVQGIKNLDNPDPYIYTFWGDCRFVNYPKYANEVLDFYAARKQVHPSISSALHHLKRNMLERSNHFDSILLLNKNFGYCNKWEMLGSFDYGDGYGYQNDEGALSHPERTYEFTGSHGAKLHWFPVMEPIDVSRFYAHDFIEMNNSGKVYAQTFIHSPTDQEVLLNIISGADVRCWLNDALVFQNRKNVEYISSLPYRFTVKLKAGNNRLLIQSGKKTTYSTNIEVFFSDKNFVPITNLSFGTDNKNYSKDKSNPTVITDPNVESFNAAELEQYSKEHPNDILEQIMRVEEFYGSGDKTKTLLALKNLRQKYPNSYYVSNIYYNNKSNVSYSSKDEYLNQNCEDCFSTLMQKYNDAKNENTKTKAKEALIKLETKYPNNYTVQMRKIEKLINDNEQSEAEKLIEEGLKKYENKTDLYYYKSSLLKSQGKKEEYAAFLQSILPEMTNTSFSNRLADYYLEKNDTTNWFRISQRDARYSFSDEDYYSQINMYKNSKKYDSAEMVFQKLMIRKPFSANITERYGDLMIDKGNKAEAMEYFKKSMALYAQDYQLIKKIRDNTGEKMEIEVLAPQTLKEIYAAKKINKIILPPNFSSRSWVLLHKKEVNIIYEGALTQSKSYYFYKILNDAGIKEFKELSSSGEGSELLIFKENGEVNLPEGYGTWVLPNLKAGDIIGIKEESGSRSGGIKTTLYQNVVTINNNAPVVESEHQIVVSKLLKAAPQFFGNTKEFKVEKKEWNKLFDMYTISAHNPLFVEPELHSSDAYANYTYMALSNYQSWDEIAKWYWDIASSTLVPHDSVSRIVKEILKNKQSASQYEKAQLLYSWLENNINYSSQSFRQDNFVPQMPNKVLEDKLGDCKDMAAFYLLMCKEIGIKGNFVLVAMDNSAAVYNKFANNAFNHCIAKIYPDGKPLYVELTSKYLPFGSNTSYSSYGFGLEVNPEKTSEIAPVYNAEKGDFMNIVSRIKVDSGNVFINENIAAVGITSAYLKDAFSKADSTLINTALLKLISTLKPNSKMYSCSYNAKEQNNDSIVMNYTLGNNEMYIDVADLQIYKVPTYLNKLVEESVFANDKRNTDLSYSALAGFLMGGNNEVIIDIPAGKTLYKTPTNVKLDNKFFNFEIAYALSADKLKIDKKFKIKKENIGTAEFSEFKTEMEKAYKADIVTVVMQ